MPRQISEEVTRKEMIDPQLERAGWYLHDQSEIKKEIPVVGNAGKMGLIGVFMRSNQARRILFVADRDALVERALDGVRVDVVRTHKYCLPQFQDYANGTEEIKNTEVNS